MARFTFKLPDIGEGISEAEIVAWHVAVGDRVEEDQQVADMMTDKATVEMESPVSGVVVELAGEVGDQVSIGAALVVIETDAVSDGLTDVAGVKDPLATGSSVPLGGASKMLHAAPPTDDQAEVAKQYEAENPGVEQVVETPLPLGVGSPQNSTLPGASSPRNEQTPGQVLASPAVRDRARALGVDLAQVKSDGERVRHSDLDAYLRYGAGQGYQTPNASPPRPDETIRVIGMRRRIAENMAASKRHIPHFTYVDECDVTALEAMRAALNASRGATGSDPRPKLTLLPLLIVAICRSLPDYPMLNARYDDTAEGGGGVVTRSGRVHMGMATQTDAGLTVPVIRDAQSLNVWQLATEIARLAEAARAGKLKPDEMGGGTITVTSLGPLGGIATTPVINRPEVAIIGPNKIVERPVFADNGMGGDGIRRAKLMNVSISCDHRVVDGWDAASYIQALKRYLETPVLLFAP